MLRLFPQVGPILAASLSRAKLRLDALFPVAGPAMPVRDCQNLYGGGKFAINNHKRKSGQKESLCAALPLSQRWGASAILAIARFNSSANFAAAGSLLRETQLAFLPFGSLVEIRPRTTPHGIVFARPASRSAMRRAISRSQRHWLSPRKEMGSFLSH